MSRSVTVSTFPGKRLHGLALALDFRPSLPPSILPPFPPSPPLPPLYNVDEFCKLSWSDSDLQSLLPLKKGEVVGFTVTVHAYIPSWYRVNNDIGVGISQPSLLAYSPGFIALPGAKSSSPQTVPRSTERDGIPSVVVNSLPMHSSGASTFSRTPPNLSPLMKRASGLRTNLFLLNNFKRKSSHAIAPEAGDMHLSPSFDSSLIGSLSLEHPALFDPRVSKTLPANISPGSQKRNSQYGKPQKQSLEDHDFDKYVDNRASVCSDPGDNLSGSPQTKNLFLRRSKVTDTKSVPFPKSDTVAANLSHLGEQRLESRYSSVIQPSDLAGRAPPLARGVGTRAGGSNKKGPLSKFDISHPTGPLYKAVPRPPTRKKIEATVALQYSGGEGGRAGYYREVTTTVTLTVRPSVIFHQVEVKPAPGSQQLFTLTFLVQNISKHRLEVLWKTVQGGWVVVAM